MMHIFKNPWRVTLLKFRWALGLWILPPLARELLKGPRYPRALTIQDVRNMLPASIGVRLVPNEPAIIELFKEADGK
jgi:hypothetical protein